MHPLHQLHPLLRKLTDRKGPVSARTFSRQLAIAPSLWTDTMAGRRQISEALLAGIAANFPDLHPDVIDYLRSRYDERQSARAKKASR